MNGHDMAAMAREAGANSLEVILAAYIHQIEFVLVVLAMVYHLWVYRQRMFGIFRK